MRYLPLAAILALSLLLAPWSLRAASQDAERLAREKARAEQARQALQRLTKQERQVHGDLARAEERIQELGARIDKAESEYAYLETSLQDVSQTLASMEKRRKVALKELSALVRQLWPLQLRREVLHGRTLPDWQQADREFVWMRTVYDRVQRSLEELQSQERAIRKTVEQKRSLAEEARTRLAAVNRDKDELLERRLRFRRELSEVRERKLSQQEELESLMELVDQLGYKLEQKRRAEEEADEKAREAAQRESRKTAEKRPFKQLQGKLPWPVEGKVVANYSPGTKPPQRGLGFALKEGTPVHAVSWGRVVHNEVLRGFGRVVILLHGEDYYSVYAFLSSSDLEKGQEVAQGEVIGRAGYYPKAKGSGVYFELRFHQKPINPRQWLIAQK